jgi:hypothetical protein
MDVVDKEGETLVSLQCDYILRRKTNLGLWFWRVSIRTLFVMTLTIAFLLLEFLLGGGGGRWHSTNSGIIIFPSKSPGDLIQSLWASMRSYVLM